MESFPWLTPQDAPYRFQVRAAETDPLPSADEGQLALDVLETAGEIIVTAPIAGVKPEDLAISLHHDMLTVRGERKPAIDEKGRYLCRECHWGKFSRMIILPETVNPDTVEATFRSGIMIIRLQKSKLNGSIPVQIIKE
ncbi:hypothetical protein A3F28_03165 [Candidatus Uhrbacteria bacterium RIFCSPHIGHO2_12_FULL_57_11]|uniref:SHSP domain-containing protein n=1 Tax=Candidatus Uhrbacteria bacterium RIFCSPHIGHO2_12_FULL_57_11 TaxID=1802398 RepID=A0A1F7UIX8_9BACT|nr:MAG: hypothetical protein A3F28_03165 [Candidatus Uhrbacteria bacterium RIFCSPHIGHO2_12_FULL_57_11]